MTQRLATTRGGCSVHMIVGPEIDLFWGDIVPAVQRSIANSHDLVSTETVRRMIRGGTWSVFLLRSDKGMEAVAVAEQIHTEKGIWLNLPFAWSDKNLRSANTLLEEVERYAKGNGYSGTKMISSRDSMGTWLKRRGYKRRFVEYVKESGDEHV